MYVIMQYTVYIRTYIHTYIYIYIYMSRDCIVADGKCRNGPLVMAGTYDMSTNIKTSNMSEKEAAGGFFSVLSFFYYLATML